MRLFKILFVPLGVLLLSCATACTHENLDDCSQTAVLDLSFSFTKNVSGEDKFTAEVNRLDLFIFDQAGIYVQRITVNGPFVDRYVLPVELPIGKAYSIVVWGDLNSSYTENQRNTDDSLAPLVLGQSTLDNARLALTHVNYEVKTPIEILFHGRLETVTLNQPNTHQTAHVELTKNTNVVHTTITGINPSATPAARTASRADVPAYEVRYSGNNGRFQFDNAIADDSHFGTYIPYTSKIVEGQLQTEITLPRMMINRRINLSVVHNNSTVVYKENLIDLLKEIPEVGINTQDDLDRHDEYNLMLDISDLPFQISITVNGWTFVRILGTLD